MPYAMHQRGNEWCIYGANADGSQGALVAGGCHPNREQAMAHMRALYRNVSDARAASTPTPCACSGTITAATGMEYDLERCFREWCVYEFANGTRGTKVGQFATQQEALHWIATQYGAPAKQAAGNEGNAAALIRWYEDGADGQINWGTPGDFEQCVAIAGQHIDDPEGFCQERHIAVTGEPAGKGAHGGALTAAAVEPFEAAFPVPAYAPRTWFTDKPDWLTPETKIEVDDSGRVAGYFYHQGQCLVHDSAACPGPSPTNYAAFHQQAAITDDGESIGVGVIGNTNGHANPRAPISVAQAHYADPDRQLLIGRAYDDEHGGYFLGALVPGRTYGDVALVRRSALSGDWRYMPEAWWSGHGVTAATVNAVMGYDCIGPTLVTRPGLPLIRQFARTAALDDTPAAILGGAGGIQLEARMPKTRTTLPGGITIESDQPFDDYYESDALQAAGPVPPQFQKKPPMSPNGTAPTDAADESAEMQAVKQVAAVVAQLVQRVQALEQQVNDQADGAMAAMEASLTPLPPDEELDAKIESMRTSAERIEASPLLAAAIEASADPSAAQRREYARKGIAMPDGSYYILDQTDLSNATKAIGRGGASTGAIQAHIVKRARALGLTDWLRAHTSWFDQKNAA